MDVISWKNKPIFTEIFLCLQDKTQFHTVKGIINAFDHIMEFCLVINLTVSGSWAVTWPPIIATTTRNISFATTLNTR